MKKLIFAIFVLVFIEVNAMAMDSYNSANNQLSIPSVLVGKTSYSNVVVSVGKVISILGGDPTNSFDTFDSANNQLAIPVVKVGDVIYKNVVITVDKVLKMDGVAPQAPLNSYFASVPYTLPDSGQYYSKLCNTPKVTYPETSLVTALDLNNDGINDLVVHFWCYQVLGSSYSGVTPNSLVAYLGNKDGSYTISNQQIFGYDKVDLGGASRKVVVADFNGDGYPDLGYAINHEDGRATVNNGTNFVEQATVIMSAGYGKYKIEKIGAPDWLHAVDAVDNELGGKDFVFQGLVPNIGLQAYRYSNGSWTNVKSKYPTNLSGLTFRFFPKTGNNKISTKVMHQGTNLPLPWSQTRISSIIQKGSTWQNSQAYDLGGVIVPYIGWNKAVTTQTMTKIDGVNYVGAYFDESCVMKTTPTAEPVYIAKFSASYVPSTWDGISPIVQDDSLINYQKLIFYNSDPLTLEPVINPILNEENAFNGFFFDCKDINNDGYQDIVMHTFRKSGLPVIYLNQKNNFFKKFETSNFPIPDQSAYENSSIIEDMDGDGIVDLILYNRENTIDGKINFNIYKGKKVLN